MPAPVERYLVEMLPKSSVIALEKSFVCDGREQIPLVGCGVPQPGETLNISSAAIIRTSLKTLD